MDKASAIVLTYLDYTDVPSCGYTQILSGSASCMLRKYENKDGEMLMRTHSDGASILAASSDGLVPTCHRTSASARQSQSTVDTVCAMRGSSPEADKRWQSPFLFVSRHEHRPMAAVPTKILAIGTGRTMVDVKDVLSTV